MDEHPEARSIVETLAQAGFVAYYAGGWVRDFVLQQPSDDIDIATNAPPETIQALFPKTVPIGIAFGIILVIVGDRQYEVATFRQDFDYQDGRRPTRVEFTSAQEDAKRRDFTINGMFYDPLRNEVLDFVGGREDLNRGIIRAIGNPHERIREDRLRMIRALRLACRFDFVIEPKTEAAIRSHANELFPAVAIERVVQELEKGKACGKLKELLSKLDEFGLLTVIFPDVKPLYIARLKHFPTDVPLIAFLLELFPSTSLDFQLSLCQFLKLSNADQQFVSFLFQAKHHPPQELSEWAHFYAHPLAPLCLTVLAAHESKTFLLEHETRKKKLSPSIERIRTHRPVVSSHDLMQIGIRPGKAMGILLKEAERIAINEGIEDKQKVFERLRAEGKFSPPLNE